MRRNGAMSYQLLSSIGILLVFAGFVITFIVVVLLAFSSFKPRGKVKGGGAVFIGPFPIVFGTDRESIRILMLLSVVMIVVMLVYILGSSLFLR